MREFHGQNVRWDGSRLEGDTLITGLSQKRVIPTLEIEPFEKRQLMEIKIGIICLA